MLIEQQFRSPADERKQNGNFTTFQFQVAVDLMAVSFCNACLRILHCIDLAHVSIYIVFL